MRATLALGAQPPAPGGGSSMDSVSTRATANPSALSNVAKALKKGPASAVDDVDELYEAGLPRGLPGGLHVIAINERAELLSRLARVKAAQEALVGRRKAPSQVSAQRAGRSFGAYDAHAPAAGAADASSSGAPQNEQGEAVAAAAAADYGAAQELDEDDPLAEEAGGAPEAGDADLSGGEEPSDEGETAPPCRPCEDAEEPSEAGAEAGAGAQGGAASSTSLRGAYLPRGSRTAAAVEVRAPAPRAARKSVIKSDRPHTLTRAPRARPRAQELAFAKAATDFVGWLFERGVSNKAAIAAAGVSKNWLDKRHKATGMSRADLLRDKAVAGNKVKQPSRASREGLPAVDKLRDTPCCDHNCGLYITDPCYQCAAPSVPRTPA